MVDPTPGTEATKVLHSSTGTSPAVSVRPFPAGNCKLVVGQRWQAYQIDAPASSGRPNAFEATNVGQMEKVEITATLLNRSTAARRAVWEQLRTQLSPETKILRCIESHEEEGWRYEVTAEPPATTLREWIACHQAENWIPKHLLGQLSSAVSALHSLGLAHLRIRPEIIYLQGEGQGMDLVLGGLDQAISYKQAAAVAVEPDFFYAPPESADAVAPGPGAGFCAWDWWSVGRVIQEVVLGRHVMSMLFGCDVTRDSSPEIRERARALLLELEPKGMRAGAVEAMPTLDPSLKAMLRGLLTSARDARWGGEAVRLWLAKENVSSHYELARNARFFVWKGRGRTLQEAAQYFRCEENWADGKRNIFDLNNPETLAHFLSTVPAHAADWKKLQEIHGHVQSADWSGIPEDARQSVAAAVSWLVFGPQPGALVVKGHRVDAAGLGQLLAAGQDSGNFEIVRALISASCQTVIAQFDSAAGEMLAQLAALGGEALRRSVESGWFDANDQDGLAYLLKLSLENEQVLRKRAERIRNTFATCPDTQLADMLAGKTPEPWAQIVLVATGENPRRYGYVTRAEQARQQRATLLTRRQQLQLALYWLRLQATLRSGRPWSGNWRPFSIFWVGLVAFGLAAARDVVTTGWLALSLVGLRIELARKVRKLTARCDGAAGRWTWRDGPDRCQTEAQRVLADTATPSLSTVTRQLQETEMGIAATGQMEKQDSGSAIPSNKTLMPVFAAAVLVSVVGAIELVRNFNVHLSIDALSIAARDSRHDARSRKDHPRADSPEEIAELLQTLPGLEPEMVAKVKSGEYEIVQEAFGSTLNGPIKKWAFTPPAVIPQLPVVARAPATSAQRAYALVSGELLVRPYGKKGVTALIVVRVPSREGVGLMVYNGSSRKLLDNQALTLRDGLPDNTWYRFERYNVIYLGAPTQISAGKEGMVLLSGAVSDAEPVIR